MAKGIEREQPRAKKQERLEVVQTPADKLEFQLNKLLKVVESIPMEYEEAREILVRKVKKCEGLARQLKKINKKYHVYTDLYVKVRKFSDDSAFHKLFDEIEPCIKKLLEIDSES